MRLPTTRNLWLSAAVTVSLSLAGTATANADEALTSLPEELQGLYTDAIVVGASGVDGYAPPEGPWRWCHSESYMGNPWRVNMNEELKRLVQAAIDEGVVSELLVSDSNGDTTQQIAQIRSFIDRDCDVITTIAGSSTALDDAIKAATDAGIAFVTTAGAVSEPTAVNIMHNHNLWGRDMGEGIAAALGGSGNILQVEGISGHPLVVQENAGFDSAVAANPDLNVLRKVTGEWTASITKSAVLQALATLPQQIDAVWTTGSETRVIAEAFAQAGRPVPLISGTITGDALGYWKENPDVYKFYGAEVSPHIAAHNAYRVGMRLLAGQKPKVNTIIAPMPKITQADLGDWYQDCMKPDSSALFPIPPANPFPESMMDGYFDGGSGTPIYDYATVPPACP